jgi:hypothetical protein
MAQSQNLSGWTEENHEKSVRIAGVLAEIQTTHILNRSQEHGCYTNLLSQIWLCVPSFAWYMTCIVLYCI